MKRSVAKTKSQRKTKKKEMKCWREKGKKEAERVLAGCGLPGSNFHIFLFATPKSLIVWPQTKCRRDRSTSAHRGSAAVKTLFSRFYVPPGFWGRAEN